MKNNSLLNFAFDDQLVRVAVIDGQPVWIAADVGRALGYSHIRQQLARLPDDEKGVTVCDTLGGPQELQYVNEPGLYRLIFRSNLPKAEIFRRWVFHEVIPSIRRTGSYQAPLPEPAPVFPPPAALPEHQVQTLDLLDSLLSRGVTTKDAVRLMLKMGLPTPAAPVFGSITPDYRDAEIDEILVHFQPERSYTIDDVVAALPRKHRLMRGSMPARRAAIGKILHRAIKSQRLERDQNDHRKARYRLPEVAEFTTSGE
jgi:prophage antirepressor-like protein